ncbi:MAG: type III pantothenate kinase [Verrucomicrobiales bacterium]|nr:type III pantothenate kinase [Verrucomicrobiales bacterium]
MAIQSAEFLLINNNNTRTKFALSTRQELLEHRAIETTDVSEESVAGITENWQYEKVILASVVPSNIPVLVKSQAGRPCIRVNHEIELGIMIDFPSPESVGADRLANAAAVAGDVDKKPLIVVDFGTAVTFDIVDTRPAYVGGVIAPGLESMTRYLHERTALLPRIEIKKPDSAIGKSTEQAMLSGAFHGYRGLVIEIINQIGAELGSRAKVVATGGYADLISRNLSAIESVDPFLTMQGLRKIANLNFPI